MYIVLCWYLVCGIARFSVAAIHANFCITLDTKRTWMWPHFVIILQCPLPWTIPCTHEKARYRNLIRVHLQSGLRRGDVTQSHFQTVVGIMLYKNVPIFIMPAIRSIHVSQQRGMWRKPTLAPFPSTSLASWCICLSPQCPRCVNTMTHWVVVTSARNCASMTNRPEPSAAP